MPATLFPMVKLMIGLTIFIGLPLLSWGLTHVESFVANPARLGFLVLSVLLQVFMIVRRPQSGEGHGSKAKTAAGGRWELVVIQILSLAMVLVPPYCDRRGLAVIEDFQALRYLGLALFALGFMTMHWAEVVLDKQFSVKVAIQEDHRLITTGPYRFLRHPRYLGIILFSMGIALIFRSWLTLVLAGALTMGVDQTYRR